MGPGKMHHRRLNTSTAVLGAVLTVVLAGCNKEPLPEPRIVSLTIVSGGGQSGFVGGLLNAPLVVRAADQDGVPVSGAQVTWTISPGGGVATPNPGLSDADGLASTSYRLGSALGQQTVQASMPGGDPVTFVATATAAPASQIAIVAGDDQTAMVRTPLPTELTVKVTDAFGNAKEGVPSCSTSCSATGRSRAPSAVTDAQGHAKVRWTLGELASTQRVAAQIPGTIPVIFDATGTPAAPALVVIVSGNNQLAAPGAPLGDSLVARVTDVYENPVKDVNVTWTAVGNAGTVNPTGGKTDLVGRIATTWTLGPGGGPKHMRAVVSGLPPATFQAAGTIVFSTVMVGGTHSCAIDAGGAAYCWGFNDHGQLGTNGIRQRDHLREPRPQYRRRPGRFSRAAPPARPTPAPSRCPIFPTAGDSTSTAASVTVRAGRRPSPCRRWSWEGTSSAQLSAGTTHTCGITTGDRLFCWGSNAEWQLGVGSGTTQAVTATAVSPGIAFSSVASGALHTCAAATNGTMFCWGNNAKGQAGLGAIPGPELPTQVIGSGYMEVVAGDFHTCARGQSGEVACWGANEAGQVGDGSNETRDFPTALAPGYGPFTSITAGRNHTCGLTQAGLALLLGPRDQRTARRQLLQLEQRARERRRGPQLHEAQRGRQPDLRCDHRQRALLLGRERVRRPR